MTDRENIDRVLPLKLNMTDKEQNQMGQRTQHSAPQDFGTLIKELISVAQELKAMENTNQSKDINSNLENIQTLIKSLENQLKLE